jgi:hypothetical protein
MYNHAQLRELMLREDARPPLKISHERINFDVMARIIQHLEDSPDLVAQLCAKMEREQWTVNHYVIGIYGFKVKANIPALNRAWDAMMADLAPRGQGAPMAEPAHPTMN